MSCYNKGVKTKKLLPDMEIALIQYKISIYYLFSFSVRFGVIPGYQLFS